MTKISDERLDDLIANAAGAAEEAWWLDDVADALTELKQLRSHNSDSAEPVAYRLWNRTDPNADWELMYEVPDGLNADHFIVQPLYLASPPAQEVEITDEMVERACSVWPKNGTPYVHKDVIREALKAAFREN